MENLESLQKIVSIINPDNILSKKEMEQLLLALVDILSKNKKAVENLSENTKIQVENLLNDIILGYKSKLEELYKENQKFRSDWDSVSKKMASDMEAKLYSCENLMAEMMSMKPKDGKDAKPEDVVPLVLEKIKLPEYEKFVLDNKGEQIVQEINDLPTDNDDLKIDAKHIRGLPDFKDSKGKTVYTAIRGPEVKIYDLSSQLDGVTKTFSLPAFRLVFDVRSSSFPYAFRPTTDYTTDGAGMTITFTNEINADATLAAGQTLYVLYLTI